MITSKSPRKVLWLAHELARDALPDFGSHFSRHDFTNAQLFACLVLREHQRKSFRGVEALLRDSPQWLADIGLLAGFIGDRHQSRRGEFRVLDHKLKRLRQQAIASALSVRPVYSGSDQGSQLAWSFRGRSQHT